MRWESMLKLEYAPVQVEVAILFQANSKDHGKAFRETSLRHLHENTHYPPSIIVYMTK